MPQYTVGAQTRRSHQLTVIADNPDDARRRAATFARLLADDPSAATADTEVVILSVEVSA